MDRPVVGVMAIVVKNGKLLMVRRSNEPDARRWSFPGGKVDRGETLSDAASRELAEETGVSAKFGNVLTALDAIEREQDGSVRFHFVIVPMVGKWQHGDPVAADDAAEAEWFSPDQLQDLDLAAGFDMKTIIDAVKVQISTMPMS